MSYPCPRCGVDLLENPDDEDDYELEGEQVRHTVKRCRGIQVPEPKDIFNVASVDVLRDDGCLDVRQGEIGHPGG